MDNKEFLKILCFYLPYQLKFKFVEGDSGILLSINMETERGRLLDNEDEQWVIDLKNKSIKPILRPLIDFVNNLEKWEKIRDEFSDYSFEHFINSFFVLGGSLNKLSSLDVEQFNILLENHFDIFGLIEKGLATDINTLKNTDEIN